MSIANDLLNEVVARLRTAIVVAQPAGRIRRDHRTTLPLEATPAVHIVDGDEVPIGNSKGCSRRATLDFTLRIFVRNDQGSDPADAIKVAAMAALNPSITAYQHHALLTEGRISAIQEIADNDSLRVDMAFRFEYTRGDWSLTGE